MNRIEKLLQKVDAKTRLSIEQAIFDLLQGRLKNLNIKKIKGSKDIFRVRIGKYRIIFRMSDGKISLITVTKRDEKTYKDY